jgi:hypothetical protein
VRFCALQNNPRDSIERLVITEKGKPEWTAIPDGFDRLDRDKPEQVANWVAATCTPGLSLKETKDEVAAKTKFYKMVHHYQVLACPESLSMHAYDGKLTSLCSDFFESDGARVQLVGIRTATISKSVDGPLARTISSRRKVAQVVQGNKNVCVLERAGTDHVYTFEEES